MQIPKFLSMMVHYYNDRNHIFKTVTEYEADKREQVFDVIVENKYWYWDRFSKDERKAYMGRRLAVEEMLYNAFTSKYGRPKYRYPVYLYLTPNSTIDSIENGLKCCDEPYTKYVLFNLMEIEDRSNISFTINDSLTSYRFILYERGIVERDPALDTNRLEDHGKLFHIDEVEQIYRKYENKEHVSFEIQVWDKSLLQSNQLSEQ